MTLFHVKTKIIGEYFLWVQSKKNETPIGEKGN